MELYIYIHMFILTIIYLCYYYISYVFALLPFKYIYLCYNITYINNFFHCAVCNCFMHGNTATVSCRWKLALHFVLPANVFLSLFVLY